ncbi:MAG: NADAR family protein [Bacteroidia bacterium]|nr:NADAR family protein [Bacteroidia bacterium]
MKYSRTDLITRFDSGEAFKHIFFWGHQLSKEELTKSCFSQWYPSPFAVEDITYQTGEHWMMAQKARVFKDDKMLEAIIQSEKPAEAKELGRKVKNFDEHTWYQHRYAIVLSGNFHKFSQHPEMGTFLKNTDPYVLVEASPRDRIWGIGLSQDAENVENPHTWQGHNLLGFALMEVRDILQALDDLEREEPGSLILPPWFQYPALAENAPEWQQQQEMLYLMQIAKYFHGLEDAQKEIYQNIFPASGQWAAFYEAMR